MRHLLGIAGVAALVVGLLAGCGGDGGASEDPQLVLEDASAALAKVRSGEVDAELSFDISADQLSSGQSLRLRGAFVRPTGAAPRFRFDVELAEWAANASPSDANGGLPEQTDFALIAGAEAAFLQVGGKTYRVAPEVFRRFERLFAEPPTAGGESGPQPALDLSHWLIEPSSEGAEQIGGSEVEHLSGAADVERIAGDLRSLAKGLGLRPGPAAAGIGGFFDEAKIDLYVGSEDQVPRRAAVTLRWSGQLEGGEPYEGTLDVSIDVSEIDQPQEIEVPEPAQPLRKQSIDELPTQLSGLGEFLAGGPGS